MSKPTDMIHKPFGYLRDGSPDGLRFSREPWPLETLVTCSTTAVYDYSQVRELIASHDRLSAEVEALRKDAERYRWLRHGDNDEAVLMVYDGEARPFDHRFDECWLPRNEKLDVAIDQAIAAMARIEEERNAKDA